MSESKHVLFVCTGNTCRSPMAEGLFRKAAAGRDDLGSQLGGRGRGQGEGYMSEPKGSEFQP